MKVIKGSTKDLIKWGAKEDDVGWDRIAFEEGMIEAWKHIRNVCKTCILAHERELKKMKGKR